MLSIIIIDEFISITNVMTNPIKSVIFLLAMDILPIPSVLGNLFNFDWLQPAIAAVNGENCFLLFKLGLRQLLWKVVVA